MSEADSLRCMLMGRGDANRKGRSVRCAWADSEELRSGREGPQRTLDTGYGGLWSSDLSLPPRRCCHNPASSAFSLGPMTGPCLALVRSKGHWPPYACATLRPPVPPALAHRLGRVAAAAAAASSRHGPASRTPQVSHWRGQ